MKRPRLKEAKDMNIQDRQCPCNVTLRHVRANHSQWKSNEYYTIYTGIEQPQNTAVE